MQADCSRSDRTELRHGLRAKYPSKVVVARQGIYISVIDHFSEIKQMHSVTDLWIRLLVHNAVYCLLQHIGNTLKCCCARVEVIEPVKFFNARGGVISSKGLYRELLIRVEALDCLCVGS